MYFQEGNIGKKEEEQVGGVEEWDGWKTDKEPERAGCFIHSFF